MTVYGLPVGDLPEGWTADGVVLLVRATDADGNPRTCARIAGRVMLWEELGMLENERAAVHRMLGELPRDAQQNPPS
ncbi:P1 family peptidase [Frankia sp. Cj3]|uniref:P1 family peptidase n=1 Tax=Frankia sp. Cj3 TaxID=2880976 RepID=UPI001EF644A6|nr:P1 family peptidase [Frankia sp. Cj3]